MMKKLILAFLALLMACSDGNKKSDDEKGEQVKIWPAADAGMSFCGTQIKGVALDETEWNNARVVVANNFNSAYDMVSPSVQEDFVYAFNNSVIIVEKTSEYTMYKTIGDGRTLYLNYDGLSGLWPYIGQIVRALAYGQTVLK